MSGYTISPVEQDVFDVLQPWLATVTGLAPQLIIQGLGNRVAMPMASPGFIVMTPILQDQLEWPTESYDSTQNPPTVISVAQSMRLTVQLDFYGNSVAGSWASLIQTLWHSSVACDALSPTCQPLGIPAKRLAPLDDSEQQYEYRWIVDADVQYNPVTTSPEDFADALDLTLKDVQVLFPG